MGFDIDQLIRLWNDPRPAGEAAFRAVYADPVTVNGTKVTIPELATMARDLHATMRDQSRTVLDQVTHGDRVTVVFTLRGTRAGQPVDLLVIDLLTIADGRITDVWAVSQPVPGG